MRNAIHIQAVGESCDENSGGVCDRREKTCQNCIYLLIKH